MKQTEIIKQLLKELDSTVEINHTEMRIRAYNKNELTKEQIDEYRRKLESARKEEPTEITTEWDKNFKEWWEQTKKNLNKKK